ncbi:MAG: hypothetical protein Kow0069_04390 [Promethearchaeota archaeon]
MPLVVVTRRDWPRVNEQLVEACFTNARRDHRFARLYDLEKPLVEPLGVAWVAGGDEGGGFRPGEFVAYCSFYPQVLQHGTATLLNGGARHVCTHPRARRKGKGTAVLREGLRRLSRLKFDSSILFSDSAHARGLYERLGWAPLPAAFRCELPATSPSAIVSERPSGSEVARMGARPLARGDLPRVAALHERALRAFRLRFAAHRTLKYWERHYSTRAGRRWEYLEQHGIYWNYHVVEVAGRVEALLGFHHPALEGSGATESRGKPVPVEIFEFWVDPVSVSAGRTSFADVAKFALEHAKLAATGGQQRGGAADVPVVLNLSQRHPLVRWALEAVPGARIIAERPHPSAMLRVVDPASTFGNLSANAQVAKRGGQLPSGRCFLKFPAELTESEGSSEPRGLLLDSRGKFVNAKVVFGRDEVDCARSRAGDGVSFESIAALSRWIAGWSGAPGVETWGEGAAWLEALAGGPPTFDVAPLDGY